MIQQTHLRDAWKFLRKKTRSYPKDFCITDYSGTWGVYKVLRGTPINLHSGEQEYVTCLWTRACNYQMFRTASERNRDTDLKEEFRRAHHVINRKKKPTWFPRIGLRQTLLDYLHQKEPLLQGFSLAVVCSYTEVTVTKYRVSTHCIKASSHVAK